MGTNVSFSFELPTHRVEQADQFLTAAAVADLASAAESAGFAACHVTDHPAPDAKWLDFGGHHALDPFVALSFAAAATSSVRVLTNVLIAAYRNPFLLAKSIQSLDLLSGGRFVLGTAAGYLKPEFAALGVDFDERNDLFDESLEVMQAVWTGEDTACTGRHFNARGVRLAPAPRASRPRPPIWIGGNSTRSIRRAVMSYEGWAPFGTAGYGKASRTADISGIDDLVSRIATARALADEVGRTASLDICYSAGGLADPGVSVEERRDLIGRLTEAGVTWLPVSIPGDDRAAVAEGIAAFADAFVT
jgi:probable F420-dependent oxidoreductase